MNGNPYTDKQFGPALSATRGFLSQYMQYMQMRQQAQNQQIMNQYRQSLMEQMPARTRLLEAQTKWYGQGGRAGVTVKLFSPSAGGSLQKAAVGALSGAESEVLPEDYKLFTRRSRETRTISQAETEKAYETYKTSIGYDYLSEAQKQQADVQFDTVASQGFAAGDGAPETRVEWQRESQGFLSKTPEVQPPSPVFRSTPKDIREEQPLIKAPAGLEDIWDTLTSEERATARMHLQRGGNIADIRGLLGG